MDEDSRIVRLREFVNLRLRREMKDKKNERSRILFFLEESFVKFRKSKANSNQEKKFRKSIKNNFFDDRYQKRNSKIKEEIGRNIHTVNTLPYQIEQTLPDVRIESYPVENGYYASVSLRDDESVKKSKIFSNETESFSWVRNVALEISSMFTQS